MKKSLTPTTTATLMDELMLQRGWRWTPPRPAGEMTRSRSAGSHVRPLTMLDAFFSFSVGFSFESSEHSGSKLCQHSKLQQHQYYIIISIIRFELLWLKLSSETIPWKLEIAAGPGARSQSLCSRASLGLGRRYAKIKETHNVLKPSTDPKLFRFWVDWFQITYLLLIAVCFPLDTSAVLDATQRYTERRQEQGQGAQV